MTLQFRMYTDEDDLFLRDYQVPADMSLAAFHCFLCTDLGYQAQNAACLYTANEEGDWEEEIFNNRESIGSDLLLQDFITGSGNRFVFLFDLENDRFFYLDLTSVLQQEGSPAVIFSNGEAPNQTDDFSGKKGSIFDEAMDDFYDFGGDDSYDE